MSYKSFNRYLDSITPGAGLFNFGVKRDKNGNIVDNGKQKNIDLIVTYMLIRLQAMFKYDNLPDVLPERVFKNYLLINGHCLRGRYPVDGGLVYGFVGGMGGVPDVNYLPTLYTVSNPALKMSQQYKINGWKGVVTQDLPEGALIRCDPYCEGLLGLCKKYATLLAETELSIWTADVNGRVLSYLSAGDDRTQEAAQKYLDDVVDGHLGVIGENAFLEGIKAQPNGNAGAATITSELIELNQYLKASWYNEIGLNANYNMKREAINTSEAQMNDDALTPLVDIMIATQEEDIFYSNKMFDENVSVEFNSAWKEQAEEQEADIAKAVKEQNEKDDGPQRTAEDDNNGISETD